jgi:hypothetical protein
MGHPQDPSASVSVLVRAFVRADVPVYVCAILVRPSEGVRSYYPRTRRWKGKKRRRMVIIRDRI